MSESNQEKLPPRSKSITKVVVGLNYTIDSLVTLFLLKKQDYDITAVTIDFSGNQGEEIIHPHCHGIDMKKIKAICDRFDVPLFATDVRSLFKSDLRDKFLQSRAVGKTYNPCHHCGHLILYTLFQKMLKLNADFIATGHYGRIARKTSGPQVSIVHSVSMEDDQSHRIIGVKQEVLRKLILPLGDLQKDEVHKIFERVYPDIIDIAEKKQGSCPIFKDIEKVGLEELPKELIREGEFILGDEQVGIGSHKGFFKYQAGDFLQKEDVSFFYSDRKKLERLQIVGFDFDKSKILCEYSDKSYCQFFIRITKTSNDFDRAAPLSVLARFGSEDVLAPGTLFFKGHQFALFSLEKPREVAGKESLVTFFSSFGVQKKLLGQAKIINSFRINTEEYDEERMTLKFRMGDTYGF